MWPDANGHRACWSTLCWRERIRSGGVHIARRWSGWLGYDRKSSPGCSDWEEPAFLYLQDALAEAASLLSTSDPGSRAELWVRGATGGGLSYRPDQGAGVTLDDRTESFYLQTDVAIYGGFNGAGDDELSDRDPATYL